MRQDQDRPGPQPMVNASLDPVSTFSLDADRASYHRALTLARQGTPIHPADVRAEEWINALDYGYAPARGNNFGLNIDLFQHPDTPGMHMARLGLKAPDHQGPLPQVNVTLVIDTSGSMREGNRIAIAQETARTITGSLKHDDNVAVVTFSQNVNHVIPHMPAGEFNDHRRILDLSAGGATNVQAGLDEGLWMANQVRQSNPEAINYVFLMSDGIANVDATRPFSILGQLGQDSEYSRRNPIRIITIGVGIQGYNDHLLEQLAHYGNGWYRYFDTEDQARRTFGPENWQKIITPFADQARAQVTWNPDTVSYWRIVGYENRVTADANFTRNLREFAEIPAEASTTVLYELQLNPTPGRNALLGELEIRWVTPVSGEQRAQTTGIQSDSLPTLESLRDERLELGVYAGLAADIFASIDQGGYGTGGNAAIQRLAILREKLHSLGQGRRASMAYKDVKLLLDSLRRDAERYWSHEPEESRPRSEGPGLRDSGYSP